MSGVLTLREKVAIDRLRNIYGDDYDTIALFIPRIFGEDVKDYLNTKDRHEKAIRTFTTRKAIVKSVLNPRPKMAIKRPRYKRVYSYMTPLDILIDVATRMKE